MLGLNSGCLFEGFQLIKEFCRSTKKRGLLKKEKLTWNTTNIKCYKLV